MVELSALYSPVSLAGRAPPADRADETRALDGWLVLTTVFVIPFALYVLQQAHLARILYPATNFALAAYLYARRSPWYAGQCVLLFCFVSLIRRLVDVQAGWDPSNPVLLTPYLCCLFAGFAFLDYWSRRSPRQLGPFLVILLCVLYAVVLAVLEERVLAAMMDSLKWSVGPLFAVYLLANRDRHEAIRSVVEPSLVYAGTVMAAYGVFQFVSPPRWDVEWMHGVAQLGMTSLGQPEPFALRVFSTMNSPGSFGAVLCAAVIIAFKRPLPVAIPAVGLMALGMALCQYRTIWGATALAAVMLIMTRPGALRPANLIAAVAVAVALGSSLVIPAMRDAIAQRAATILDLRSDESLESRLGQYTALTREESLIVGSGLALSGASRRLDHKPPAVIDSGLIEIWRSMGLLAGTLFLGAIVAAASGLFRAHRRHAHHLDFDRALVTATFIQLPMGSVHIGELGFCAWLFLGLGLATLTASVDGTAGVLQPPGD